MDQTEQQPPRSPEEFERAAIEYDISWWPIRECSICTVPIGYRFIDGAVAFISACGCNDLDGCSPCDWSDVAQHYNMQSHPRVLAEYDAFWRFTPATAGGA